MVAFLLDDVLFQLRQLGFKCPGWQHFRLPRKYKLAMVPATYLMHPRIQMGKRLLTYPSLPNLLCLPTAFFILDMFRRIGWADWK